ncbi:MAG: hypothetical protein ACXQTZ_03455 [Candidatus Alkanophagales archaeon]
MNALHALVFPVPGVPVTAIFITSGRAHDKKRVATHGGVRGVRRGRRRVRGCCVRRAACSRSMADLRFAGAERRWEP